MAWISGLCRRRACIGWLMPQRTQLFGSIDRGAGSGDGLFCPPRPLALASQEDRRRVASAMADAGVDMPQGDPFWSFRGRGSVFPPGASLGDRCQVLFLTSQPAPWM